MNYNLWQMIYQSIDWASLKITGGVASGGFLLGAVTGNGFITGLTVIVLCSTLLYNIIRIVKELKNKKQK